MFKKNHIDLLQILYPLWVNLVMLNDKNNQCGTKQNTFFLNSSLYTYESGINVLSRKNRIYGYNS